MYVIGVAYMTTSNASYELAHKNGKMDTLMADLFSIYFPIFLIYYGSLIALHIASRTIILSIEFPLALEVYKKFLVSIFYFTFSFSY